MTNTETLDFEFIEIPQKEKPNKIKEFANKFFYSYWYFLICTIFCTLSWYFNIPDISFCPLLLFIGISLILLDDITPIIPSIFMVVSCLPRNASFETSIYLAVYLIPVLVGVVYHLIKYQPNKIKGKMFWSQIAVAIVLIMGGLGSNLTPDRYVKGLPTALGIGLGGLAIYLLILNYAKTDKYDFKEYFAKCMVAVGFLYGVQMLLLMFANPEGHAFGNITHDMIVLGGLQSNAISHMMMIMAPFGVYLAVRRPKFMLLHLLSALFIYATSLLTYSRGCLLFTVILAPIVFLVAIAYAKGHRGKMLSLYVVILIGIIAVCILFKDKLYKYIDMIIHVRDHATLNNFSTGRIDLYREARLLFQMFPAFGTGLGYISPSALKWDSTIDFLWFHSTFWQVLGSLGIVGFLGYLWLYVVRYKLILTNLKKDNYFVFVFIAMLAYDGYSLLDANSFLPMPFIFLIAIISASMEKALAQNKMEKEFLDNEKYTYKYN